MQNKTRKPTRQEMGNEQSTKLKQILEKIYINNMTNMGDSNGIKTNTRRRHKIRQRINKYTEKVNSMTWTTRGNE